MKYQVLVTETLQRTVEVEAETPEDAKRQVKRDWFNSKIVLNADDFVLAEFSIEE